MKQDETICAICDGTGWKRIPGEAGDAGASASASRVVRCDCWRENLSRARLAAARIPKRYQHCTIQNFTAAESTIRDLDMAEEMTKFSKSQILSQAGTAMLAQANQSGQGVLQLLRG